MSVAWVGLAVTAYSAYEADSDRDDQMAAINSELDLAKSQYDDYKTNIMPLEIEAAQLGVTAQQLAVDRGQTDLDLYNDYYAPLQEEMVDAATDVEADYDRVTRDAAADVDNAFAQQSEINERDASRMGLRPDSGRYKGMDQGKDIDQAATRSFAVNRAREAETDRVDNTKFSRMNTALTGRPGASAPMQSSSGLSTNPNNLNAAYANQASMYGANAASASQGAADAMYAGASMYSQFKQPTQTSYTPFSGTTAQAQTNFDTMDFDSISADSTAFKDGGLVEGPRGVDRVPGSINNNEPAALTSGEFVIPKDVVQKKGTEFFEKMLMQYHEGGPQKPNAGLNDNRRMH